MPRQIDPERPSEFVKSPLAASAACFALGIALAPPGAKSPSVPLLFACAALCLVFGLVMLRADWRRVSAILALAGFVAAGAAASRTFEVRFPPNHVRYLQSLGVDLADPIRVEGRVVSTPLRSPYGLQFDVDVARVESRLLIHTVTGKVRLRVQASDDPEALAAADSLHLQYGDSLRALVRLRKPRLYQNPGSFNFRRWLETIEDLYWVGTIKSPYLVEKLPRRDSVDISNFFEKTRHRLLDSIERLYPPWSAQGRDGAVLKAALLGDRAALDSDTVENFRKTGLYHLLVIAGLHVGLLAMLVGVLLRAARLRQTSRGILLFLFLLSYAFLVEQRAPTLRATLMISAYVLAGLLYREHNALNAVGLAGLILLLHRPAWLFESGFQLSFSAALLIATLAVPIVRRTTEPYLRALRQVGDAGLDPYLEPRLAEFRLDLRSLITSMRRRFVFLEHHSTFATAAVTAPAWVGLWAANTFIFTAVLQLGLLLPLAGTFHRVSLAGVGLNALAIPVMTLLLGLGVPVVILGAIAPALAAWPARLLVLVVNGLFALTDLPNLPAWLSFRVPEPPGWVSWGFALSVVFAAWALGRHLRAFWAGVGAVAVFAALVSLHPFAPRLSRGVLEVTALDCGGGDAIFLALPDRTTVLVDAGGSRLRSGQEGAYQGRRWDAGEDIVSPYLWSRGVKKIDILVLTHAHQDHMGGLAAVVRNFRVGEFWIGANPPAPAYLALLEQVRRRGILTHTVAAGEALTRGPTTLRVLWPPAPPGGHSTRRPPSNDDSVVLRVSSGQASVLLTGDISGEVEQELTESRTPLQGEVLKVAHHGSKSSSTPEFLARVAPRVALVSGEAGDPMNLPSPETIDRLRAVGARVFRTDLEGAVTIEMRGGALAVTSYRMSAGEGTVGTAGVAATGAGALSVP